ncbi:hypothetical protein BRADI_1g01876v3 [Brachypodium distachyon]|uniref:Uncharacterized protein n=1 Tax=Brachypodium distachyon TaxID=15368 RepID=A0A2K2DHR5_BRADI|nr:hypothetical protein BRADI_1g01876v3 [Brachypodium distachyon]
MKFSKNNTASVSRPRAGQADHRPSAQKKKSPRPVEAERSHRGDGARRPARRRSDRTTGGRRRLVLLHGARPRRPSASPRPPPRTSSRGTASAREAAASDGVHVQVGPAAGDEEDGARGQEDGARV